MRGAALVRRHTPLLVEILECDKHGILGAEGVVSAGTPSSPTGIAER